MGLRQGIRPIDGCHMGEVLVNGEGYLLLNIDGLVMRGFVPCWHTYMVL